MIKSAQVKFICIIMAILFGVFSVIFTVSYLVIRKFNEASIERSLNGAMNTFTDSHEQTPPKNGFIVRINPSANGDDYLIICFDQKFFTEQDVRLIVEESVDHLHPLGSVENVYYKMHQDGNSMLLVAMDMSESVNNFRTISLNIFTTLLVIYLILFLIVWRLSFVVFRPIKDALYKQKQFISNASHELKTPITIISANADVINANGDNAWANNIKTQTERLDVLVADMLTLAKIDEDKLPLTSIEFNLSEEIVNSTLPFDAVAFERGKTLELDVEDGIIYKGDLQSVKKVVNILLDNAVKHAAPNGIIKVSLKKENGKIILSVFNTGSNIPSHESNKVFERFYRGDASRSRESGGSGLGLSITKSIADANKWKISANSKLNESMTITVIF